MLPSNHTTSLTKVGGQTVTNEVDGSPRSRTLPPARATFVAIDASIQPNCRPTANIHHSPCPPWGCCTRRRGSCLGVGYPVSSAILSFYDIPVLRPVTVATNQKSTHKVLPSTIPRKPGISRYRFSVITNNLEPGLVLRKCHQSPQLAYWYLRGSCTDDKTAVSLAIS